MNTAIILAGAHVWKSDSLEYAYPRLLWPVANTPLVEHILVWLAETRVRTVMICANNATRALRLHLREPASHGLDIRYYEDRLPRGPAGCASDAAAIVPADHYVVLDGSVVPALDLGALLDFHEQADAAVTIVVDGAPLGPDDLQRESTPTDIYVFAAHALRQVPATGYRDIKEMLIPQLHDSGARIMTYLAERHCPRINGLESYFVVQDWMLDRIRRGDVAAAEYVRSNGTYLHAAARVAGTARFLGPVMVGPQTRIGDGAMIVGPTVIGSRCTIGRGSVIGRCVLWDDCQVGTRARLEQCLVTSGSSIEPGAVDVGSVCCS